MAPDWAALQTNLLYEIGKHITSIESYDSFGAVCRSWRVAAPRDKQHLMLKTFGTPLLMLPQEDLSLSTQLWGFYRTSMGRESPIHMREFLNVSTGKILKIYLPEATEKNCLSWKDWLFIYEEDGTHMSLLHLVSHVRIQLPDLFTFCSKLQDLNLKDTPVYCIKKVMLTENPNSTSDFTVIILLKNRLYFYKLGNTAWTAIELDRYNQKINLIVYQKNYLYTYDRRYGIVRWDVNGTNPTKPPHKIYGHLPQKPPIKQDTWPIQESVSMVEFSNRFYFIYKYSNFVDLPWDPLSRKRRTSRILVYEGIIEDNKLLWTEIWNLGNKAIYLGRRSSFMVECDNINNCKPNCIYFTNDSGECHTFKLKGDGQDMGIYHLSDGSVEAFINVKIEWSKLLEPIWIGPRF